ncbi:DUF551 domain-containing protein [Atopobium minutum]|uniref:DUF551 domain-containing protein n=1 Tax=Atopobium minutum TaxID=1381 RepID=A0AB38A4V1_9ACTN|nr:DUF551 domain-containing protein [Atopobium minutum]SEB43995.1 Protein of unknown function [Atopobium minutum]
MEWIPVSERLPDDDTPVLITVAIDHAVTIIGVPDHTAYYGCDCGWIFTNNMPVEHSVTAWMPLPEPYEEQHEHDVREKGMRG